MEREEATTRQETWPIYWRTEAFPTDSEHSDEKAKAHEIFLSSSIYTLSLGSSPTFDEQIPVSINAERSELP